MGYIIQDVGLFPHMTIAQNIQMPAKIQRKKILPDLVAELLQLVGLDTKMGARYPRELSGGQQQRIGIARALAGDPEVILMDEPFSALDNLSRIQLQNDFLKLDHLIRKTVVMVTHDIYEAFKLGDRIAILNEGKLQQIDTPANLLLAPANQFVAGFLKNDSLLLRLHNTPIKDLNTPEDMSLFEALESSAISTEQKLQLMRTFFEMQQQQAHE